MFFCVKGSLNLVKYNEWKIILWEIFGYCSIGLLDSWWNLGFFFCVYDYKLFIILFDFVKGILYIKLFDSVYK